MTPLLRQISVGTGSPPNLAVCWGLSAVTAAGLVLTGSVKLELAHPQIVVARLGDRLGGRRLDLVGRALSGSPDEGRADFGANHGRSSRPHAFCD